MGERLEKMEFRCTSNSPPGTIICILCRGFISFVKNVSMGDFFSHLSSEKIGNIVDSLGDAKNEEDTLGDAKKEEDTQDDGEKFISFHTDLEEGEVILPGEYFTENTCMIDNVGEEAVNNNGLG